MYFDEDLMLDLRLNILDKYVKKFIITESTYLHSGKKKKLNFDINNFQKFKDKIIYIVVDKLPNGIEEIYPSDGIEIKNRKILDNSLKRENNQRVQLIKGLTEAHSEDVIFSSDLDEIPNLKKSELIMINEKGKRFFLHSFDETKKKSILGCYINHQTFSPNGEKIAYFYTILKKRPNKNRAFLI